MASSSDISTSYCFGPFRFELAPYRLSRSGELVEITPQQAQLLEILLSERGEIVPRELIRQRLWPDNVHVDFDRGINFCIARLRAALEDRSGAPRYIETVPRRGYRFVGCEPDGPELRNSEPATSARIAPQNVKSSSEPPSDRHHRKQLHPTAAALSAAILISLTWFGLRELGAMPDRQSRPLRVEACNSFSTGADLPPAAAAAFHRASYFASRPKVEDRAQAIEALDEVLAHRPDFEPALSCQARLYYNRHDWRRAEPLAERALELTPARIDAHLVLAEASFRRHFDWPEAEKRFLAALRLYPHHEELRIGYANLLSATGRATEATMLAQRTVELHPLSLMARSELAEELYLAEEFEKAIDVAERVVQVDARYSTAFMTSLYSRLAMGQQASALALGNRMLEAWGWGSAPTADLKEFWDLAIKHKSYGDHADQNQLTELAVFTMEVGRGDEARRLMERACAERSGWSLPYYDVDPRFRRFHSLPGLQSLALCLREPFDLGRTGRAAL